MNGGCMTLNAITSDSGETGEEVEKQVIERITQIFESPPVQGTLQWVMESLQHDEPRLNPGA